MNEDHQLTGQILHNLDKLGVVTIGRKNANPVPNIILNAIGIQIDHARIVKENEKYFLRPACKEAENYLYVNGNICSGSVELVHLDRICFGVSTFFIFKNQARFRGESNTFSESEIDWEFCQQELSRKNMIFTDLPLKTGEFQGNSKEAMLEFEKETLKLKAEYEEKMEIMKKQHEEMLEDLKTENMNITRINDGEREEMIKIENEKFAEVFQDYANDYQQKIEQTHAKREKAAKEVLNELKEKDKDKLEQKLIKINPNIVELNLIAKELKRNIVFSPHVVYMYIEMSAVKIPDTQKRYHINIKVDNHEEGSCYFWNLSKFSNRYFQIKDLLHRFYETGVQCELPKEQDPFWDPPEYHKIGQCFFRYFVRLNFL